MSGSRSNFRGGRGAIDAVSRQSVVTHLAVCVGVKRELGQGFDQQLLPTTMLLDRDDREVIRGGETKSANEISN